MPVVTADNLCKAIGGTWVNGDPGLKLRGISCRCAVVKRGILYFDYQGGKGGDRNILDALKRGAVGVVISKFKKQLPFKDPNIVVISVPKVGEAFWAAVKHYRDMYNIPVVGVTGSSGKTTTTAMISSIFRRRWKVLKTMGNLNLPSFVPAQIMRLKWGYQAAVFEIGMNRPGQVSQQSRVVQPQVGIITHIGTGHIEHLGSFENVILEKSGIMEGIPENGCILLNADDPATKHIDLSGFKGKVACYGLNNKADYMARDIMFKDNGTYFMAQIDGKWHQFFIPTYGKHNVYNALAAIGAARFYNFDVKTIIRGLERFRKPYMRLQIVKGIKNCTLINDTYNANPDSIMAGLEVLSTLARNKKSVAVLGNMLEQGEFTVENHRKVGKKAEDLNIDWVVTVGTFAKEIANGVQSKNIKKWSFNWIREAVRFLRENLPENSVVLVKGSRGAHMERLVKGLKTDNA